MSEQKTEQKVNLMREIFIEKVVLSCGGVKDTLEKEVKLLKKISKKNPSRRQTTKRIPGFSIRPKLEVGCMVTLRGREAIELLKKLLSAIDNSIRKKQIAENHFSFGIPEYIEIPGEEYDREIGMMGFSITVVFSRKGRRVSIKKIKRSHLPKKQKITQDLLLVSIFEDIYRFVLL